METLFQDYFSHLTIGGKKSFKNMAVFPLLSKCNIPLKYLTPDDAVAKDAIEVVEVRVGGHVPELKAKNKPVTRPASIRGISGST